MSVGDTHGAMGLPADDRLTSLVATGGAVGLTALALVIPASAIVTGPVLLLSGLIGIRRIRGRGAPLHLLLVTTLGAALTIAALFVAVLLVSFS